MSTLARCRVKMKRHIACLLVAFSLLSALSAQNLRDPRFMALTQPGFDHIYNLDYDAAEQVFLSLKKGFPQHPAPPLYLAVIDWLRELFRRQELDLNVFMSPSFFTRKTSYVMPPERRQEFLDAVQECQDLANGILKKNPGNTDALYILGSSYGVLSAFAITIDHSMRRAFTYGNRAYDFDQQVLKIDPGYHDARMTVGLYQYVVGSIPWYLRWLAAIAGYSGTKEQGFNDLDLAVAKGSYAQVDAEVIRMALRVYEGKLKEALLDAQGLHRRFPRNFIFQINIAQILEKLGRKDQAVSEYLSVMRQAEEARPNYSLLPMATFRYTLGYRFFRMGRPTEAAGLFAESLADRNTPDRERTLSQLRLGQVLDLQGRRAEAITCYQVVLSLRDFENAQEQARRFLRSPYRG